MTMTFVCDNCGKTVTKEYMKRSRYNQLKHHFCCTECYLEYRRKHPDEFPVKQTYSKLIQMARLKKELTRKLEVMESG